MALIICPECNKEISDRAKACPNCAFPIEELNKKQGEYALGETKKPVLAKEEAGVLFKDITEQKHDIENMYKSEARFRALVSAISEVVYVMSPDWSEMRRLDGKGFLSDTDTPSCSWLQGYILPEGQAQYSAVRYRTSRYGRLPGGPGISRR